MKKKISSSEKFPEFQESLDNMPIDSKIFVDKSLAIANYIQLVMQHQHIRQKDLAELMGKTEAEISKWLNGMHNYTLRSLSKIEAALGSEIICIPDKVSFSSPATTEYLTWRTSVKFKPITTNSPTIEYSKSNDLNTREQDKSDQTNALAA